MVAPLSVRVPVDDPCQRLDWVEVFGNTQPVELDLGAGDGGFAVAYAGQHPERNLLAVERLLGRVRKIEKRTARAGLSNLRVLRLELTYFTRYLLPAASVATVHILFPDPWPKRRHWHRRLIQPPFLRDLSTALRPGGELRFATDHADYFADAQEAATQVPDLRPIEIGDWTSDPKTDFQLTFEAEGRATHRLRWQKKPEV